MYIEFLNFSTRPDFPDFPEWQPSDTCYVMSHYIARRAFDTERFDQHVSVPSG